MKQLLTIIFIFALNFTSKAQVCSSMHIRGPLLVCATPVSSNYHVLNSPAGTGVWSVVPSTAGTVVPSGTSASVYLECNRSCLGLQNRVVF